MPIILFLPSLNGDQFTGHRSNLIPQKQQAIQSDVSELIEREENRAKLLPVLTALHTAGWEINIPTSNNAVS